MNQNLTTAIQAIQKAEQELQRGNRQAARHWAELAASVAPELEMPWLILAGLASPGSSIGYLKRALAINPQSERARRGMSWALRRLRQSQAAPLPSISKAAQLIKPEGVPPAVQPTPQAQPHALVDEIIGDAGEQVKDSERCASSQPVDEEKAAEVRSQVPMLLEKNLEARRRSFIPILLILACFVITLAAWSGNASPALAFIRENISPPQGTPTLAGAAAEVLKPTYTPTFTPTYTPTPTASPTPTFTDTPTPTLTFTPTITPLPTDTPLPVPTYEPPTPEPIFAGGGERWIDVDLSQQMVYAYEGNVVVNGFLVSTGTWQHPTVTGQYYIYIKLLYANMSGPGYYLPNVPYTMYFYKGYALHGTYWHHNFGTPMSHGCVNLSTPDAEWLYYWASIGTLVNVHY